MPSAASSNPLNHNRFQFMARKQFCPLPFPTANFAYEKGRPFERAELLKCQGFAAIRIAALRKLSSGACV
jgi:hypothetical protein